jgi:pantoate--beta-alanine ligase
MRSTSRRPAVVNKLARLRRTIAHWRAAGETVALVPTMGALHAGHLALVRLARRRADRVVVSIFVNPAQFGPNEDFATYPRTFATDVKALHEARADLVWSPAATDMYADDFAVQVVPEGAAAVGLEDAARPHFFAGVATVVTKLLIQCMPDIAVFGEKDYQQLRVVTALARDLDLPVKIVGALTVREADGLAMASRNVYLTPDERAVAPVLHRVLKLCAEKIAAGRPTAAILAEGRETLERAGFVLDYLEARDAETLRRPGKGRPLRLLAAATLGRTRLIDNVGSP